MGHRFSVLDWGSKVGSSNLPTPTNLNTCLQLANRYFCLYLPKNNNCEKISFFKPCFILFWSCNNQTKTIKEIAAEIHEKVLTVDTHTDTPWSLLSGDFDLSERHDYYKDRSRVDFPECKKVDWMRLYGFICGSEYQK